MRFFALFILFLLTIGGWGLGILTSLFGKSAIHEILSAVYFLIGTVAFGTSLIFETLNPAKKDKPTVVLGEVATGETHVRCPWCKGLARKDATICMHCRKSLAPAVTPSKAPFRSVLPAGNR